MSEVTEKTRIAVVLFNLGGPDSLDAVKPFLFNLFYDKYIITLPAFFRYFVAKLISGRREHIAKEIYANTGNKSPILAETMAQKANLEKLLNGFGRAEEYRVFICMRHWHPMVDEVIKDLEIFNPDKVVMLPLYPQFSTTTTASSFEQFSAKIMVSKLSEVQLKAICCYPDADGFIDAHVGLIEEKVAEITDLSNFRLLFSAHGLPEKIVKAGDPYQWQVEKTTEKIIEKLKQKQKFKAIDYKITYQSRVGPLKWLEPNTEEQVKLAGTQGKSLIIIPVAFVSEHVETLVELDIEYKKIADELGITYLRVATLSICPEFINALANMVFEFVSQQQDFTAPSALQRICPKSFTKCPCKMKFKIESTR